MEHSEARHILVLAAGRGTRMGVPKALMSVGGTPWWTRQQSRLERVGLPVTWVVSDRVARESQLARTVVVDDTAPMFESIRAGVASLGSLESLAGVFILPVDVPAPEPGVWRELGRCEHPAVPVWHGRRGHPVYLPGTWLRGRDWARAGRLDDLIRADSFAVRVGDPDVTVNLNTPQDVDRWLSTQESSAA